VKVFPTFREITPSPSAGCAGVLVLPNHQHTLNMGTDAYPETSIKLCDELSNYRIFIAEIIKYIPEFLCITIDTV
jgi:hypothetical protein